MLEQELTATRVYSYNARRGQFPRTRIGVVHRMQYLRSQFLINGIYDDRKVQQKKMVQGTKRKKKGEEKKKPSNTRKNMENTDEHTHTTKQK